MVARATLATAAPPAKPPVAARRPRSSSAVRFATAYFTALVVLGSYLRARLGRSLFGEAWYDARIGDLHQRNARRVERTVLDLQGLFIKVGQLLSIMANFLPDQFRTGLEKLQDQVPPHPFTDIEQRVLGDLGKPVDELFSHFERQPIASASLGQVHEARLLDGTRVAVKVQHREIERITRLDLAIIRRIMWLVQWFVPVQGLDAYYHQIKEMIGSELDFLAEAANIERLSSNFEKDPMVVFPRVVRDRSTRRVLTTTFVEGVKVGDLAALDSMGVDRKKLAQRILRTYCQMIFVDGVYHADPHPGNLLVQSDGSLVLLDFGAVAELSPNMREGIPEFLEGVIRRDTSRLIAALRKMGFLARGDDDAVTEKVIEYFHRRFQDEIRLESFNLKDIRIDPQRSFENFVDLKKMNIGLRELSGAFHVPRDWVLLERTLLLLTGVCTHLDPEMNPMEVVRPYLQEFVFGNRDFSQIVLEAGKDIVLSAITLPEDLRKYLTRAVRGELEVRVRGLSEGALAVRSAVRQACYAAFAMTAFFAGVMLRIHHDIPFSNGCFMASGALGAIFFLSGFFGAPAPRR